MRSRDFCYWLQGFFELTSENNTELTDKQIKTIQAHLNLVFAHEIDPEMGDKKHQENLNKIHSKIPENNPILRC